jgi:hypothetical protein
MSPTMHNVAEAADRPRSTFRLGSTARASRARGLILLAAGVSFVLSVSLWFAGNEDQGLFVGIWVPSIISLGAFLMPRVGER